MKRLVAAAFLIVLPIVAAGQQDQKLRDRDRDLAAAKQLAAVLQQANFHRGGFYLVSRLRLSDAGFSQGGVIPTGDQSGGISIAVEAPQRIYFVPRKKLIFSAEAIPGYTFFREGDRSNQFNYLLRGDAHLLLNHLYLDVYALRADQLRAHVSDINRLATAREDEIGVAGEVKYSSRTSGQFALRSRDTSYPTNRFQPLNDDGTRIPVQVLDRGERSARASFLHKTFPRTSFFAAGEVSDYDFVNKQAYDSRRTYFGGGLLYDAGRTTLRLEGGPVKLDFDDATQRDYEGMTAQLRLSRSNGRWVYSFGADRDLGFSIFQNNAYYVATGANARVDYSATRKLSLNAQAAFERDDYDTPLLGRDRSDDISFTSVGFTYAIRRARVGADVGWYERDSTAFGDQASGIRYVLRLSLNP